MKLLFLCASYVCLASEPTVARFESSAIEPNLSGGHPYSLNVHQDPRQPVRVAMQNVPLKICLQYAWSLSEYQVFGPSWIGAAKYDIAATMAPEGKWEQVWPAMQQLLTERFQLNLQHDTKTMKVYALTVAKGGSKLEPGQPHSDGAKELAADRGVSDSMHFNDVSMAQFCQHLTRRTDRLVVDRTGLVGNFRVALKFHNNGDRSSLSLFSELQKQLGLKLEARTEPVEILTVKSGRR